MKKNLLLSIILSLLIQQTAFSFQGVGVEKDAIENMANYYLEMAEKFHPLDDPSRYHKTIKVEVCEECNCCIHETKEDIIIAYSPEFYDQIVKKTKVGFDAVLTHEIGHFVMKHTNSYDESKTLHQRELEADYISGQLMNRSGMTLKSALEVIGKVGSCDVCDTHPPLNQRNEAIMKGWTKGFMQTTFQPKYKYLKEREKIALNAAIFPAIKAYCDDKIPPSISLAGVLMFPDKKFKDICYHIKNKCKRLGIKPNDIQSIYSVWECTPELNVKLNLLSLFKLDDQAKLDDKNQ
jgi:hypothetical protein